jgi:predicted nucleic acid-binding protein
VSWLLDADVLSQPAKRHGDPRVTAWLETEQDDCYTSAVVLSQLAYWVRSKEGRERQELQAWLTRLMAALHGRVLSFNASVAHVWAEQQHELSGRVGACRLKTATLRLPPAVTTSRSLPETKDTFAVLA